MKLTCRLGACLNKSNQIRRCNANRRARGLANEDTGGVRVLDSIFKERPQRLGRVAGGVSTPHWGFLRGEIRFVLLRGLFVLRVVVVAVQLARCGCVHHLVEDLAA